MATQQPQEQKHDESTDWRRHRHHEHTSHGILGGLIVITLGLLLFLANQGIIGWDIWWQYFLLGLGIVFLIDGGVRYLRGEPRAVLIGRLVPGLILMGIGITFLVGATAFWPVIIIAAGIAILISALVRRPKNPQ